MGLGGKQAGRNITQVAGQGANNLGSQATGAAGTAASTGNAYAGKQAGYANAGDKFASSLLPASNGALSPYVKAQLAQQKNDIDKTYQSQSEANIRGLAQRGMGGAPTGLRASITNTAGQQAGQAENQAYANAMNNTAGLGLQGVNYMQNQEQIFDPLKAQQVEAALINSGANAYSTGANAGYDRTKEGSLAGDIFSGLSNLATTAASG
jgi:hypothetical protein